MKLIEQSVLQDQLDRFGKYRLRAEISGQFIVTVLVQIVDGAKWATVSKSPRELAISEKATLVNDLAALGIRLRW